MAKRKKYEYAVCVVIGNTSRHVKVFRTKKEALEFAKRNNINGYIQRYINGLTAGCIYYMYHYDDVPEQCKGCQHHQIVKSAGFKCFCPFTYPEFHDVRVEKCILKKEVKDV